MGKGKFKKDKKQDNRLKTLENFVYKTIENKQINSYNVSNVDTSWVSIAAQFYLTEGSGDGQNSGDAARIGNSVTLMRQAFQFNFKIPATGIGIDSWNQVRLLVVESKDGSQTLDPRDILQYWQYATHGDLVFSSPYTTKATTNKMYKVHLDRVFTLNQTKDPCKVIKHAVKYKGGKVITFDGLNVYPNNHRFTCLAISDSAAALHPVMNQSMRATYKDA